MENLTIGFIGAGNMGSALIAGLLAQKNPPRITVAEHNLEQRKHLSELFPTIKIEDHPSKMVANCSALVLAVKPQGLPDLCADLKDHISPQTLIISIAAGITTTQLSSWLRPDLEIIRTMPNTPALVGSGATALYAAPNVGEKHRNIAENVLRSVGLALWVDEEIDIDKVTALSGSGPAYVFLLSEAMENAAIALGLSPGTARLLTLQTIFGASKLALESQETPTTLRKRVTSPGGTTAAALAVFEERGFSNIVEEAIRAAFQRAQELAQRSS